MKNNFSCSIAINKNSIKRFKINNREQIKQNYACVSHLVSPLTKIRISGFWSSGRPDVDGRTSGTRQKLKKKIEAVQKEK